MKEFELVFEFDLDIHMDQSMLLIKKIKSDPTLETLGIRKVCCRFPSFKP